MVQLSKEEKKKFTNWLLHLVILRQGRATSTRVWSVKEKQRLPSKSSNIVASRVVPYTHKAPKKWPPSPYFLLL